MSEGMFTPLSTHALERLDAFLLARFDNDADSEGKD